MPRSASGSGALGRAEGSSRVAPVPWHQAWESCIRHPQLPVGRFCHSHPLPCRPSHCTCRHPSAVLCTACVSPPDTSMLHCPTTSVSWTFKTHDKANPACGPGKPAAQGPLLPGGISDPLLPPASLCSQICDHGAQAPKIKAADSWALGSPRGAVPPRNQLERWDLLLQLKLFSLLARARIWPGERGPPLLKGRPAQHKCEVRCSMLPRWPFPRRSGEAASTLWYQPPHQSDPTFDQGLRLESYGLVLL